MRRTVLFLLVALVTLALQAQQVQNPAFDKELKKLLDLNTNIVSVDEIADHYDDYIFLDAREPKEYLISHIPNAINIGFRKWDKTLLDEISKDSKIIVYCSVGYRSEKITEKIRSLGYNNAANLYGSIFEWANCNLPLEDSESKTTMALHTYNRKWSQWVTNSAINIQY